MTNNIYCMDTSSLIDAQLWFPIRRIHRYWDLLEGLVYNKQLIAPIEVLKELKKNRDPYNWAYAHKDKLFFNNFSGKYASVQSIISECPGLIDPNKKSQIQADPYLIALVLHLKSSNKQIKLNTEKWNTDIKYIILTEEQGTGNPNKYKVPDACKKYGIDSRSIRYLLELEDWKLE